MFGATKHAISRAIDVAREATSTAAIDERAEILVSLLRAADAMIAAATDLIARDGIQPVEGRPVEHVIRRDAGYTHADAAMVSEAASVLTRMPAFREAFAAGLISWGQVRRIIVSLRRALAVDWHAIDAVIGEHAKRLAGAEPDRLVERVDDEIARLRPQRQILREDRLIARSFLAIQPMLDGGATFYGEADPVSAATIIDALDAVAEAPAHPDRGATRARQRMDAWVQISEMTLAGNRGGLRPRPRVLATVDVAGLRDDQRDESLRLLWSLPGRAPRLSRVTRDELLCDATIVPVVFNGHDVIGVGDERNVFSNKVRTAIVARDRHCRMCGRAPASWGDVHHLDPGKGNTADDGCLLCRRCHRTVHRYGWTITRHDHGILKFERRGKHFLSHPP